MQRLLKAAGSSQKAQAAQHCSHALPDIQSGKVCMVKVCVPMGSNIMPHTKNKGGEMASQPATTVSPEHNHLLHETRRGKVLRLIGPTPTLQCHHPQDPDLKQLRCRPEVWGPYAKAIEGGWLIPKSPCCTALKPYKLTCKVLGNDRLD